MVVGIARSESTTSAYRWTESGGLTQLLGNLPTDAQQTPFSNAVDVSADGTTVVGVSSAGAGAEAFRWTSDTGITSIGDLPGGDHFSAAQSVSENGNVVVGISSSALTPGSSEAFLWTEDDGMVGLGLLEPSDTSSEASFTSANGDTVFGRSFRVAPGNLNFRSFVWRTNVGMRDFVDVLENDFGLADELAGWTRIDPMDISANSLTIVGSGVNPAGNTQAWLVKLDHAIGVAEPTSLSLAVPFLVLGCGRRLRKKRRHEGSRKDQDTADGRELSAYAHQISPKVVGYRK